MDNKAPRRTGCAVWLLCSGFGLISLSGWLRFAQALTNQTLLQQAGVPVFYVAVSGVVWGLVALNALVWIWFRFRWSSLVGCTIGLFLAITYWADRLASGKSYSISENLPFAFLLTVLGLVFCWGVLHPINEIRALNRKPPSLLSKDEPPLESIQK